MRTRPPNLRRTIDARLGLSGREGASPDAWAIRLPRVVTVLGAMMLAVFAYSCLLDRMDLLAFEHAFGFVPARFGAMLQGHAGAGLLEGAGPLVSHVFVHGNLPHLTMNAAGLAIFGTAVARRFQVEAPGAAGRRNTALFLAFFLASGVAGALVYGAVNAGSGVTMVGASGAISGAMAGAIRFALRPFAPYGPEGGALAPLSARPVAVFTAVYVGFNLLTPLGIGTLMGGGLSIAWEAHIGGYLFGLFAFPGFDRATRDAASG